MTVSVFSVRSLMNQDVDKLSEDFLSSLGTAMGAEIQLTDPDQIHLANPCIVFIASGGSETQFVNLMPQITAKTVYLLTSGHSNSLAASMEILSYLRAAGKAGEIIHGDLETVAARMSAIVRAAGAKERLRGMRLGQIGAPSDWLIASHMDRSALSQKLGMEIIDIPIEELIEEYEKHHYEENQWTEKLKQQLFDRQELEKALDLYGAFDRLVVKYGLGGLTVRCFDLLTAAGTTGCLGLAILNARGIYGGCEGDMPSLVSMAILGEISGKPVFMCNPSRIDVKNGEMVFAHCTLPLNMPYEMSLATHFESDKGVAIAGSIPEGEFTIFKVSGDLDRFYAEKGVIEENLRECTLCRSQIKVKLPSYDYFLERPISNHHLVCCGDYREALKSFMKND